MLLEACYKKEAGIILQSSAEIIREIARFEESIANAIQKYLKQVEGEITNSMLL